MPEAAALAPNCPTILNLSTDVIEVLDLRDKLLGEPGTIISDATVTARVLDFEPMDPIAGIPDPITLSADGGGNPNGDYRGTIPATATLTVGQRFRAIFTALDSGNTLTITTDGVVVE